jgi:hypothetical protein
VVFNGFIAAISLYESQVIPYIVLDQGTLTLPDGRIFKGEFSAMISKESMLKFSQIPVGA